MSRRKALGLASYQNQQVALQETVFCKRCCVCEKIRHVDDFYKKTGGNLKGTCIDCYSRQVLTQRQRNPIAAHRWYRTTKIRKYGLTLDQYDALKESQNGVCAICLKTPSSQELSVDHDHKTGKVRGLLCSLCNLGIGNLQDSIEILKSAERYLDGHK